MKKRTSTMARSRRGRTTTITKRRATTPTRGRGQAARKGASGGVSSSRRSGKMTTDHEEIQQWVEARGGHPATVKRTVKGNQSAGVLRIDFPGFSGEQTLEAISWDEWFRVFDERRLAFLYQDRTAGGKPSRFNKLVCRP